MAYFTGHGGAPALFIVPLALGGLAVGLVGVVVERGLLRFVYDRDETFQLLLTFALLLSDLDPVTSFSAVLASINNMGPGLNRVGPHTTYQNLSDFQTWVCTIAMLLGRLLEHSPYFTARLPQHAEFVRTFPRASLDTGNGFLYWALDRVEDRPVVSVTHVSIVRNAPGSGLPLVTVAGLQVFATHYYQGSLGLTYLVGDGPRYLVYVNRTELDVLGGFLGGLKRAILESRLKKDITRLIGGLRRRLG